MTALPQPPAYLLMVAEYAQLGEATTGYTELQEGNLIRSPSFLGHRCPSTTPVVKV